MPTLFWSDIFSSITNEKQYDSLRKCSLHFSFFFYRFVPYTIQWSFSFPHSCTLADGVGQQQIPLCCCITYSKWVDEWRRSCMNVCLFLLLPLCLCMGVCDNIESVWPWSFNNYLRMFWWRCCCFCCRWCRCCVNGCVLPFRLLMLLLCVMCFVCVPACQLVCWAGCGEVVELCAFVCVSVCVHVCKYST